MLRPPRGHGRVPYPGSERQLGVLVCASVSASVPWLMLGCRSEEPDNQNTKTEDPKTKVMASNDFSSQGTHEVQECLEGEDETDLHNYFTLCEKNPSHEEFVPVNDFTKEYLPDGYRDDDLYNFIKTMADLTVRIAVTYTSLDRPELVQGTEDPHPANTIRGTNTLRTGTGRVYRVTQYTEGMEKILGTEKTCPCPICKLSGTHNRVWWLVHVLTAGHVILHDDEVRQSIGRLWFDEDESNLFEIYGLKVEGPGTEEDYVGLYFVTHDVDVVDKLNTMINSYGDLLKILRVTYTNRRDVDKLNIIVSHPHGCSKQVSVGRWVEREYVQGKGSRYWYTTCTCPGSSGAQVYRLGYDWSNHPHSGTKSGLNYSGFWFE